MSFFERISDFLGIFLQRGFDGVGVYGLVVCGHSIQKNF